MKSKHIILFFGAIIILFLVFVKPSESTETVESAHYSSVTSHLEKSLSEMADKISLEGYNITKNEVGSIYFQFLEDHPELFFIDNKFKYTYSKNSSIVTSILPVYTISKKELKEKQEAFNSIIDKALTYIDIKDVDETEEELVTAINNYLCTFTSYNIEEPTYSAYDALVDRTAVCEGYAKAFKLLADKVGLVNDIVVSDEIDHMWNRVKIGTEWFHVDTTWNDPYPDVQGYVDDTYLLLTDEEIKTTHYNWY